MSLVNIIYCSFYLIFLGVSCQGNPMPEQKTTFEIKKDSTAIITGAEHMHRYFPLLDGKNTAIVCNQTSIVGQEHLVDTLLSMDVKITKLFAPEHGIRGAADAGAHIESGIDQKTGLPIISLYGSHKKPTKADLSDVEIIVFDIQDVGVRFYTYISTLHYVMEAAAEQNIPVIVLDRPNPNGHYVDGPILQPELKSFVGMHPVPIVYGMTIGEYARMINGEQWLSGGVKADLTVIELEHYSHADFYNLPIKPSPNLPNAKSILLYPWLCLFEGTTVSIGRGTDLQFQIIGHPEYPQGAFSFTPQSKPGATHPKHEGKVCYGSNLSTMTIGALKDTARFDLGYVLEYYKTLTGLNVPFFNDNNFFDKLAGTYDLRKQIETGMTEEAIRATWQQGLEEFKTTRAKYLLYN